MVNATGWTELYNADLVGAAYTLYNAYFGGWFVVILFFMYQFMLYLKTQNVNLMWVTGVIFVGLYATSIYVKQSTVAIMVILLVFELGGIIYFLLFK